MRMGWTMAAALAVFLTSMVGVVAPAQLSAQGHERECRCVGPDGAELEDCVCVRMPEVDAIVARSFPGLNRPRLGISLSVTEPSDQVEGARIMDVLEDGPADRAGLREGDVITRLDGRALTAPLDGDLERELDPDRALPPQRLLALVRDIEAGDQVEVEYLRDGRTERTNVVAAEIEGWGAFTFGAPEWDSERFQERIRGLADRMRVLPPDAPRPPRTPRAPDAPRAFHFEAPGGEGPVWLDFRDGFGGLELVRVTPELGSYFGTDRGMLVTSVPDASALGLRPGDVILEIDGRGAEDPSRVRAILASYDTEEAIGFRIRRDGREMDVSGRLGTP